MFVIVVTENEKDRILFKDYTFLLLLLFCGVFFCFAMFSIDCKISS